MKTITEIRNSIPKIKLMLPGNDTGIARFKLRSTKHTQHVRIIFSWHSGFDVIQAMFKLEKRVTPAEIAEIKRLFFREEDDFNEEDSEGEYRWKDPSDAR